MSKKNFNIKLINFLILLKVFHFIHSEKSNNSQVYIFTSNSDFLGNPYDEDSEIETIDRNCNVTEYPEQAIKCNNLTNMECEDMKYLHHCKCVEGYMTYRKGDNYTYCNYLQKKQLYAFILEFCAGFGAGHFYRHAFTTASLKLVAFVFGIVFICTFPITAKTCSECECDCCPVILSIFYYLYLCGLAVWYIIDIVNFGNNNYKDLEFEDEYEEGVSLKPW